MEEGLNQRATGTSSQPLDATTETSATIRIGRPVSAEGPKTKRAAKEAKGNLRICIKGWKMWKMPSLRGMTNTVPIDYFSKACRANPRPTAGLLCIEDPPGTFTIQLLLFLPLKEGLEQFLPEILLGTKSNSPDAHIHQFYEENSPKENTSRQKSFLCSYCSQ